MTRARRNGIFVGTLVVTAIVVAIAVAQTVGHWRAQRAAMREALRRELRDTGARIAQQIAAARSTAELVLVAPIYGIAVSPGGPRFDLETFDAYTSRHLRAMELDEDPAHGAFRLDLERARPSVGDLEVRGALRDSTIAAAVLRSLVGARRRVVAEPRLVRTSPIAAHDGLRRIVYTVERTPDDRALAIVGVSYSESHWIGRFLDAMLAGPTRLALLPPSFYGVDWIEASRQPNDLLDVEVREGGRVAWRRGAPDGAASAYRETLALDAHHTLAVGLRESDADRLVAAAVPFGPARWIVVVVALLGAAFVAAALAELRRRQQLAEAQRNFVSAVSHELRTPLAHMALLSETLLGPAGGSADQRARWLGAIHREAIRLGRLLDNVLLHARGERRELAIARRATDVAEVVREVLATMTPVADTRGTTLRALVPERCVAHVDDGALRQVLVNLLDNAIKYGPDGQTVVVTASDEPGAALVLTVDDEGPGIAPGDHARVWKPFVRVDGRGGATGGSGLGLSVVRELARLHDGDARIERAPSGGARVTVTLRLAPGARDAAD